MNWLNRWQNGQHISGDTDCKLENKGPILKKKNNEIVFFFKLLLLENSK